MLCCNCEWYYSEATTDAGTSKKTVSYTKCSCQIYGTFYQNLKLTQFQRKLKIKEIIGYNMFAEWTETDRQTATLNSEISTA
jgi:hypothetical protein